MVADGILDLLTYCLSLGIGRSRSANLAATQRNLRRGRRNLPIQTQASRHAWPALLRWCKKSACPVRLSGRMATPTIDLVAKIW